MRSYNHSGRTVLHLVASRGYVDAVSRLLKAGANLNSQDQNEWTPLHLSVAEGHAEMTSLLVATGANLNLRDSTRCCGEGKT